MSFLRSLGLEILAFPCNQFGGQEPESEIEIKKFVTENYDITFPMFSKVQVSGPFTHEVFRFLRQNSELQDSHSWTTRQISWNFAKFLVNKEGNVIGYYPPDVNPNDMIPDIRELLGLEDL